MKKLLLSAIAVMASLVAGAQNYTAETVTTNDADWDESFDNVILINDPITVEAYDGYVIIREFLGAGSIDLKVAFDADENVTSITPITKGIEGDTYTSGYAAFETNSASYYYTQIYLGESYDYANADEDGGYVTLSGYFYSSQSEYVWAYYNIAWEKPEQLPEGLVYTAAAKPEENTDWAANYDGVFMPDTEVLVEGYEDGFILRGWTGALGDDLKIEVDAEDNIVAITPIVDDVEGERVTSGYCAFNSNSQYYYITLYVYPGYGYANNTKEDGYAMLSGYFYTDSSTYTYLYYYLSWGTDEGAVKAVNADINAPIEYYNLQGVRVENPANGLYIMRQGDKAVKVIR